MSASVVAAFGATLLVWWFPAAAAACAVLFAGLDVWLDPVTAANVAWPVLALLHLGHLWLMARDRAAQRATAARASEPLPRSADEALRRAALTVAPTAPVGAVHVGVVALLLAAVVAGASYLHARDTDERHTALSRVVTARVTGQDDETGQTLFSVQGAEAGVPGTVRIETLGEYRDGDVVQLRVDPDAPGWTHLVAEPPDPTWWVTLALGALLVAGLLSWRLLTGRVHRSRVVAAPPRSGVRVRFAAGDDLVPVLCTDTDRVAAELEALPRPRYALAWPRLEAATETGWLVGDVRPGGWASLVHLGGVDLAVSPLRALPDLPLIDDTAFDPDLEDDPFHDTLPVPPDADPEPLPAVLRPTSWRRAVGWVGAAAVPAALWWVLDPQEVGWFQALGLGGVALSLVTGALEWAAARVEVRPDGVALSGAVLRRFVPMAEVADVRVTGDVVVLVLEDGDWVDLGPWPGRSPGAPAAAVDTREPSALGVAAAVDRQRLVARATPTGQRGLRSGPGPQSAFLVPVVAVLLVRLVTIVVGG